MKTKTTHTQARRAAMAATELTILSLFGFSSEMQYYYMQLHRGWAYLRCLYGGDEDSARFMERQPMFWKWWRNQWLLRDEELLLDAETRNVHLNLRRMIYKSAHDPDALASVISPRGLALDDSYNEMIGELNKTLRQ